MCCDPATPSANLNRPLTLAASRRLLEKFEAGEIDRSFVVTHPAALEDAPAMYKKFRDLAVQQSKQTIELIA
jgi:threonine dehydrogenase-like Zn-dependent dehydrogenase